jgi:hypothetical protein
MANYNEQLQRIWHAFEEEKGQIPSTAREAVAWGVAKGMIDPPEIDPLEHLAGDMAKALREEYSTDRYGRRYRINHAVRVTKGSVQITFWAIMDFAPRPHMERAFAQRRRQIVGDCFHLKTDVDVYNDKHRDQEPIQVVLNFTDDVMEAQGLQGYEGGEAA